MRKMTVEQALRWAYVEELPKSPPVERSIAAAGLRGGWDGVAQFADYLAMIDTSPRPENAFGLAPDFTAVEGPHPDAVRIHEAVTALDDEPLVIPDGWYPLDDICDLAGDLGALGVDAVERALARIAPKGKDGLRQVRMKPSALIRKHAILGGAPEWRGEVPERKLVLTAAGRPAWFVRARTMISPASPEYGIAAEYVDCEVDGFNRVARRPYPGAYHKWRLEPDPAPVVEGRVQYELWRWGVEMVAGELVGNLQSIALTGVGAPEMPWRL